VTIRRRSVVLAPLTAVVSAAALLMPVGPLASAGSPGSSSQPQTNSGAASAPATEPASDAGGTPTLTVTTQLGGLDIPWDVEFIGKKMLFTERDKEKLSVQMPSGEVRTLFENPSGMWHSGETGLMGLAVDPGFATNRWVYTCNGFDNGATHDIRVVRWQINEAWTVAAEQLTIVGGIQITTGRHGGCRLRFAPDDSLYIGTGDSVVGTNPQDLTSLNGKTLRVNQHGQPWPTNPFISSPNANTKKIDTYGHRNVQGLAYRPHKEMWSIEHGTDRDDEVNKLKPGGNYGWNPVPGYDESAPMTDHSLPGRQIDAKWSSGFPTIATSGAAWLTGDKWGSWKGRLAAGALVGEELRLMEFTPRGALVSQLTVPQFDGDFGRLRAVVMGPEHNLYITTSNGGGTDRILKVSPS
jgi:glucose/arabinose dehydrogenase